MKLYCIVLYCRVWYCIVLYCIVLYAELCAVSDVEGDGIVVLNPQQYYNISEIISTRCATYYSHTGGDYQRTCGNEQRGVYGRWQGEELVCTGECSIQGLLS